MVRQPVAEKRHLSIIAGSSNSHLHQLWNLIRYAVIRHKDQKHYSAPTETDQETLISNRPTRYKIRQPSSSHLTPLTLFFFPFQHGWLPHFLSVSPQWNTNRCRLVHTLIAFPKDRIRLWPNTRDCFKHLDQTEPKQRGSRYSEHGLMDWAKTFQPRVSFWICVSLWRRA